MQKVFEINTHEADDGSGDVILELSEELMDSLGWKVGDELELNTRTDGSIEISKAEAQQ